MNSLLSVFRFGLPYLRRYWGRLALGVGLGVLFGLSNALFIWATKTLFERVAAPAPIEFPVPAAAATGGLMRMADSLGASALEAMDPFLPLKGRPATLPQVLGGLLFLPLLGALRGYLGYLSSYFMGWTSERVIRDLRLDVLAKLNSLSLDFFNRSRMGDLLARVNGDTNALYRCLNLGVSDLVKEPVTILGCLVGLLMIDPGLTLLAVVFLPMTVVPIRILGKKVKAAVKRSREATINQDSLVVESFSGIRVVKAFGLEGSQMARFRTMCDELVRAGMKSLQAKELINPIIEIISMVGLGVVIVYVASSGANLPGLVAFLTGVAMMYTPVKKLGNLHVYFQQASVGAERLLQIFAESPHVREPAEPRPLQGFSREISLENVSFGYGGREVLRGVTLRIPRGMKLGIAGPTGAGKSTFANLLLRFYDPTAGRVAIDGLDLREVASADLRAQIAFVSQEVVIFDQSIADNIACGKPGGATRAEVEAAARAANAHDFILATPNGYESRVGERGVTLSGGQRQRLAIARAFVRDAPILVLDEATASLDSRSEGEVQAAIDRLSEHRTVVCIAHRLSTLKDCGQIIVIDEGEIRERGTFEELLRQPLFGSMAARQGFFPASTPPAANS